MSTNNENINKETKNPNVPHLRFPEFFEEWKRVELKDVAEFQKSRIPADGLDASCYISTENLIPNFGGIKEASSIPTDGNVMAIKPNDILISNIRPYLKKVWQSDRFGGCSADVFVLRTTGCQGDFLYNIIASDKFINYVMSGVKGVKMPRGDKRQMEEFEFSIPTIEEQNRISRLLSLLDERIATQNKIIEDLKKLKSAISHILFSSKGAIHLSEIANVVMGQSPSSNAYNDQGLGMPLVQGNLDISNGKTTPRLYTAEFNQMTEKGNIILTVRAPVGEVAKATQKVCLGRGVCAIIPHEENMSDFIYQYLTFYKFMWRRYVSLR